MDLISFVESLQELAANIQTTIVLFLSFLEVQGNKMVCSTDDISQMSSWSEILRSEQRQTVEDAGAMIAKANARMGQKPNIDNRVQVNVCAFLQKKLYPVTESVMALNTIVGQLKDMNEAYSLQAKGNRLVDQLRTIVFELSIKQKEVINIVNYLALIVDSMGSLPASSNQLGDYQSLDEISYTSFDGPIEESLESAFSESSNSTPEVLEKLVEKDLRVQDNLDEVSSTSFDGSTEESLASTASGNCNSASTGFESGSTSVVFEKLVKDELEKYFKQEDAKKAEIFKLKRKIQKEKYKIAVMTMNAKMKDLRLEEEKIEARAQATILKAAQKRITLPEHLALDFVTPPTSPVQPEIPKK